MIRRFLKTLIKKILAFGSGDPLKCPFKIFTFWMMGPKNIIQITTTFGQEVSQKIHLEIHAFGARGEDTLGDFLKNLQFLVRGT